MIDVYERLKREKYRAKMLLQVHDELVFEVHKDDLEKTARMLKEEMENAVILKVPLLVDLSIGKNWRDKEDYHI